MVELVDTAVLGTVSKSCTGSSPVTYKNLKSNKIYYYKRMHSSVGRALDF